MIVVVVVVSVIIWPSREWPIVAVIRRVVIAVGQRELILAVEVDCFPIGIV